MLSIHFGKTEDGYYGPGYFNYNYEQVWFEDPFVQEMVRDVDKSEYRGGLLFESEVLGPIAPDTLSGGVKTLILIYKEPDKVFDATSCGDNCAKWLVEIGKKQDVTVNLNYLMSFEMFDPLELQIVNSNQLVHSYEGYVLAALDVLEGGDTE